MVKFETVHQSTELSAVMITAEYTGGYSEEDFTNHFAISFPLHSAFNYKAGKTTFPLDSNYILFEKGGTEFTISKFSAFNKDVTLSISFLRSDSELPGLLSKNSNQVMFQRRTLQTEIILRKFCSVAYRENETLKEQLLLNILNTVAFQILSVNKIERTNPYTLKQIDQSKDFIHAYYHKDLRIADIASAVHLSPFHFSRLFRQITKYTPYEYLLLTRIENAKSLLQTGMPVTQAAFSVGFNSLENFSFAFNRVLGCSPSSIKKSKIS